MQEKRRRVVIELGDWVALSWVVLGCVGLSWVVLGLTRLGDAEWSG